MKVLGGTFGVETEVPLCPGRGTEPVTLELLLRLPYVCVLPSVGGTWGNSGCNSKENVDSGKAERTENLGD